MLNMFGLMLLCDILGGSICLIKRVIYLRIMYQLIKSQITLNGLEKLGQDMVVRAKSNVD